jgi:4-oxalocrotonate tautomerase
MGCCARSTQLLKETNAMPHVTVQLLSGRTTEAKRAAAKAITEAIVKHLNTAAEGTTVVFQDIDRESWARGGELIADRK